MLIALLAAASVQATSPTISVPPASQSNPDRVRQGCPTPGRNIEAVAPKPGAASAETVQPLARMPDAYLIRAVMRNYCNSADVRWSSADYQRPNRPTAPASPVSSPR